MVEKNNTTEKYTEEAGIKIRWTPNDSKAELHSTYAQYVIPDQEFKKIGSSYHLANYKEFYLEKV